jgi:hypothetical protein
MTTGMDYVLENLDYLSYCAEQEFLNTTSMTSLDEASFKDTVTNMINTIFKRIQDAWTAFKEKLTNLVNKAATDILNKNKDRINNKNYPLKVEANFLIPNIAEYNKFMQIKLPAFNEDPAFRESLKDKDTFIKEKFPYLYQENDGKTLAMKDAVGKKVFTETKDDTTVINDVTGFAGCIKTVGTIIANINSDIGTLNASAGKVVAATASTAVQTAKTAFNPNNKNAGQTGENTGTPAANSTPAATANTAAPAASSAQATGESALLYEADEKKETFKTLNTPSTENGTGDKPASASKELSQEAGNYMKICSELLSTKMSVSFRTVTNCITLVTWSIKGQIANSGNAQENTENNTNNQNANNNTGNTTGGINKIQ